MPPLTKTPQPNLSGPLNGSTNYQSLDSLIHSYPYLDVEVNSSNLFEGAWKVVSSIFTTWKKEDVKFHQCKDGITNQCKYSNDRELVLDLLAFEESVEQRRFGQ